MHKYNFRRGNFPGLASTVARDKNIDLNDEEKRFIPMVPF
jgi:hypothetical protein